MRNKFTRGGRFPDGIPSMVAVGALEEHWARLRLIELVRSPPSWATSTGRFWGWLQHVLCPEQQFEALLGCVPV